MQQYLQKIEQVAKQYLRIRAPFQIPEPLRKSIALNLWIAVLLTGLILVLSAWDLWRAGQNIDRAIDSVQYLSRVYGGLPEDITGGLNMFFYLSLLIVVAQSALLLVGVSAVRALRMHGWRIVFYATLLQVVLGAVRLFATIDGGLMRGIVEWTIALASAYVLLQVQDYFKGVTPAGSALEIEKTAKHVAHTPTPAGHVPASKQ